MSDNIYVQYLGFEAKALVRQYIFGVREVPNEPCEFILTIANEAFVSHRVRYQDGPDICSLKLLHELAIYANHRPKTHFCISDAELENYRDSQARKPLQQPLPRPLQALNER